MIEKLLILNQKTTKIQKQSNQTILRETMVVYKAAEEVEKEVEDEKSNLLKSIEKSI